MLSTPLPADTKGSKTTVQGDAKVIQVDYYNEASVKHALTGLDVVISTVPIRKIRKKLNWLKCGLMWLKAPRLNA